jgi:hypothetical protein
LGKTLTSDDVYFLKFASHSFSASLISSNGKIRKIDGSTLMKQVLSGHVYNLPVFLAFTSRYYADTLTLFRQQFFYTF